MKESDKRWIENFRVRRSIQDALLTLMKHKHVSQITVSDIIGEAGVARASYYRNYDSLNEVVRDYLKRMDEEIDSAVSPGDISDIAAVKKNLMILLSYYKAHREEIMLLFENGFPELLQENTDQFIINALGDMPAKSIERYNLYFLSGAISRVQLEWMKNDCADPVEDFAELNIKFFQNNLSLFRSGIAQATPQKSKK